MEVQEISEGRQLAIIGAQTAANHADAVEPGWQDNAFRKLVEFLTAFPDRHFQMSEVIRWATERGFSRPPDGRAWGSRDAAGSARKYCSSCGICPMRR